MIVLSPALTRWYAERGLESLGGVEYLVQFRGKTRVYRSAISWRWRRASSCTQVYRFLASLSLPDQGGDFCVLFARCLEQCSLARRRVAEGSYYYPRWHPRLSGSELRGGRGTGAHLDLGVGLDHHDSAQRRS